MNRQASSSSSTILLVIVLIITFPVWIVLGGVVIGLVAGLFGIFVGVVGALFGVAVTLITLPFKILFGWGDWGWGWHGFPHMHWNGCFILALLLIAAFVYQHNKRTRNS